MNYVYNIENLWHKLRDFIYTRSRVLFRLGANRPKI